MNTLFETSVSLTPLILIVLAASFTVYGYVTYFFHAKKESTRPNPWSWAIWGVTTLVEAATYDAVNPNTLQSVIFYISAASCIVVSIAVWRYGKPRWPTFVEWLCLIATAASLVVWLVFHQEWWAHLILVLAIPISFIPIWIDAWKQPMQERAQSWVFWSLGDVFALMLILYLFNGNERELPYIIAETTSHLSMLLIVVLRRKST